MDIYRKSVPKCPQADIYYIEKRTEMLTGGHIQKKCIEMSISEKNTWKKILKWTYREGNICYAQESWEKLDIREQVLVYMSK